VILNVSNISSSSKHIVGTECSEEKGKLDEYHWYCSLQVYPGCAGEGCKQKQTTSPLLDVTQTPCLLLL